MTTNTNEKKLLYLIISGVACGAYSIDEGYERVYGQLQKVREEEREQCIKAISNSRTLGEKLGVSVECEGARWQAIWDIQKINHSELDQPKSTGENGYSPNAKDIKGAGGLNGLVQDKV